MRILVLLLALLVLGACPASAVLCGADSDCTPGWCVRGACVSCPTCLPGEGCLRGECLPRRCGDTSCHQGQVCRDGACVGEACASVGCLSTESCGNGACYPRDCSTVDCTASEVCLASVCTFNACVGVVCGPDTRCADGRCIPTRCEGVVCAEGAVCADGRCVPVRCLGVVCVESTACVDGRCLPQSCKEPCGPAQACLDGRCVSTECTGLTCPSGQRCVASACQPCAAMEACTGGEDEDCDGATDCADGDCASAPACSSLEEADCTDGRDDDGDGRTDCADPACEAKVCTPSRSCARPGTCSQGECQGEVARPAGRECRASRGPCDPAEACDGTALGCPSDGVLPRLTACAEDANPCTLDVCDGAGACTHPAAPDGTTCGAETCQAGECGAFCSIAGVRQAPGAINPQNPCQVCTPAASTTAWTDRTDGACPDDGDPCTEDRCASGSCSHPAKALGAACGTPVCNSGSVELSVCTANGCEFALSTACPVSAECQLGGGCEAGACVPVNDLQWLAGVPSTMCAGGVCNGGACQPWSKCDSGADTCIAHCAGLGRACSNSCQGFDRAGVLGVQNLGGAGSGSCEAQTVSCVGQALMHCCCR